jgi:CDP-paratose 2-epimerase
MNDGQPQLPEGDRPYREVLLTGGAGFVGSHVALALRTSFPSLSVTVLDNLRRRGSELNVPRLTAAGVRFVHGDIRNPGDFAAVPPPDLLIECSAEPSATAGYGTSPDYVMSANLVGCFHCLELARRSKADFVFISTSRVYPYRTLNGLLFDDTGTRYALADQEVTGASRQGISEELPLDGPRSLYGMTKLAAELMVEEYGDAYGIRFIINRCGLLTGPWQMARSDQGVVALWLAAHVFGRPLKYVGFNGSGKQVRDFLHVSDFCELLVAELTQFDAFAGRPLNVGGGLGFSFSLRELTEVCRAVTGNRIPIDSEPGTRPADVRIYITDHRRLSAIGGWRPRRDLRSTVEEMHAWMLREGPQLERVLLGGMD